MVSSCFLSENDQIQTASLPTKQEFNSLIQTSDSDSGYTHPKAYYDMASDIMNGGSP